MFANPFWRTTSKPTITLQASNTQREVASQTQTLPSIIIGTKTIGALEEVRVNMAELKAENKPIDLVTSVGSCVAICIHDPMNSCGGLAHIMLPDSSIASHEPLPAKFADTAVPALVTELKRFSRGQTPLYAKIAGGANMFPTMNALNIGSKNVDAVKAALKQHKIQLLAEDVGGSSGRKITFNIASGVAIVKRFNGAMRKL